MKKILFAVPLALALYACGDEAQPAEEKNKVEEEQGVEEQKLSDAEQAEWEIDERLQEPTEDTTCYMCNMKVYTRDHEQGIFSAQAVREDGQVVFYDDIGCLLNDEYKNKVENEKFVRDYHTLNWFNVEEAFTVKTDIKSPMNWGYIFFKFEEDAKAYVAEHENAAITPIEQIREEGIERFKKKQAEKANGHDHTTDEGEPSIHQQEENMSSETTHN